MPKILKNSPICAMLLPLCLLSASPSDQNGPVTPEIVEKASRSVVLVKGTTDSGGSLGSGFLLSSDGKIATNLHVIRDLKTGGVQLPSGEIFDTFSILAFDERKDLAILQIAGFDLPAIELGNSNDIKPGEPVIAIGSPRGLQGTVTAGIISSIRDDAAGFRVIQTDAAANPGNSGGPLMNAKGQVIGVVSSKLKASEGLNFAVPINYVRGLMASTGKPISLGGLRAALNAQADSFKDVPSFPEQWKSMVSGNRFKLRSQNDIVYVEQVLPVDARSRGVFYGWELHKGASGYSGVQRRAGACNYGKSTRRCSLEINAEFIVFTASRIEGRLFAPPENATIDCKKCSFDKPFVWSSFVWIPE